VALLGAGGVGVELLVACAVGTIVSVLCHSMLPAMNVLPPCTIYSLFGFDVHGLGLASSG
jgi:hypothetical protein